MPTDATPHPSLAQLLLADDRDAVAGFRDAHADAVRAYCEQACPPQLREEAFEASFVDFLGRLQSAAGSHVRLEELLFKATRAAAAARFNVQSVVVTQSRWAPTGVDRPEPIGSTCRVMPEVLAAYTNGELEEGDRQLRSHLERCVTCQATVARMERAERVFAGTGAARQARPEPAPEPEAEPEPLAAEPEAAPVAAEPQPAAEASPAAEPTASPPPTPIPRPAPEVVRVRRGGLLGAARKMTGGTPPSRRSQS